MKHIKAVAFILFLGLVFSSYASLHKYYISITQVEFIEEKQSIQFISRIHTDDLEKALRKRYDSSITLGEDAPESTNLYLEKYLKSKIKVKVNEEEKVLNFIGVEYKNEDMHCYLEIENIKSITSFEITNQVLFDLFDKQENIVKVKINNQHKSFVLIKEGNKGHINFDWDLLHFAINTTSKLIKWKR